MCRSKVDNAIAVNLVKLLSVNKVSRLADFFFDNFTLWAQVSTGDRAPSKIGGTRTGNIK